MPSCTSLFLKSKYLYLSLVSSLEVLLELTSNGRVLYTSPNTSNDSISTSISPVFIFLLIISSVLFLTIPVTVTVLSRLRSLYFSTSFDINCTIPFSSLNVINKRLPKFLIVSIHPASLTSLLTYSFVTSPQYTFLYLFSILPPIYEKKSIS